MLTPLCAACSKAYASVSLCGACALGGEQQASHDELGDVAAIALLGKARRCESVQDGLAVLGRAGVVLARRR